MSNWRHHAELLDQQPNNRRFAQLRTPRTLREAGLSELDEYAWQNPLDYFLLGFATSCLIAAAVFVVFLP